MALNYDKTKELRICFKKSTADIALLIIDGRPIQQVKSTRLLGVTLFDDLKWQSHIDEITTKASQHLYFNIYISSSFSKEPALTLTIGIGVRMPSVAFEKSKQNIYNTFRDGRCGLFSKISHTPKPSPQTICKGCQTGGRSYVEHYS